jgi:hypothetical protein
MPERRKVERPEKNALHQMIWSMPITKIAIAIIISISVNPFKILFFF